MTKASDLRAERAAEAESIAAGEADATPKPPQTPEERIAELEGKLELLMELTTRPASTPLYPEHISAIISPPEDIIPGSTVRPTQGPVHLTTGKPIFNGGRPTGRAG